MARLSYTYHAEFVWIPERKISKANVERVVFGPDARPPYVGKGGATPEFSGALADGRKFYVVTNAEVTQVITVVAYEDPKP